MFCAVGAVNVLEVDYVGGWIADQIALNMSSEVKIACKMTIVQINLPFSW